MKKKKEENSEGKREEKSQHGQRVKRKENERLTGPVDQGPKPNFSSKLIWTPSKPNGPSPIQFGLHYSLFTSPIRFGPPKNPKPN
jgi:hypothetical protein